MLLLWPCVVCRLCRLNTGGAHPTSTCDLATRVVKPCPSCTCAPAKHHETRLTRNAPGKSPSSVSAGSKKVRPCEAQQNRADAKCPVKTISNAPVHASAGGPSETQRNKADAKCTRSSANAWSTHVRPRSSPVCFIALVISGGRFALCCKRSRCPGPRTCASTKHTKRRLTRNAR